MNVSPAPAPAKRRVRVCYFNTWAGPLEDAAAFVARARAMDLAPLVADPHDEALMRKARLDCDWFGENTRCFASMRHEGLEFLPAWVCGSKGLIDLPAAPREPGEERWLISMGQQPQALRAAAGKVFGLLARMGVRHFYYAFDEASRAMACFNDIAPHLDVLIHDELPLADAGRARLRASCRVIHRSWVANVVPFAPPFNETPEEKIFFLGSNMGLTPNRRKQIAFLSEKFKDRFVPSYDHSPAEGERTVLNRYKVGLCPEGRMFTTPAMSATHTDRPFWTGCLGMVPVSEDSQAGGRLEELHRENLIMRYAHGDLKNLGEACERALALTTAERRRIYEHFNGHETVGAVVAAAMAEA